MAKFLVLPDSLVAINLDRVMLLFAFRVSDEAGSNYELRAEIWDYPETRVFTLISRNTVSELWAWARENIPDLEFTEAEG